MFKVETKVSSYVAVKVTDTCNRQCPFCVDSCRGHGRILALEDLKKALEAVIKIRKGMLQDVLIVGGEVTTHPQILDICRIIKDYNLNLVCTSNATNIEILKKMDKYVDSFNISWYEQAILPEQKDFTADITLSAIIYKGRIDTKEKLDNFIDYFSEKYILKFATLSPCNKWAEEHLINKFVDELPGQRLTLFDSIEGQIYRGCVIKREEKPLSVFYEDTVIHPDGIVRLGWDLDSPIIFKAE